MFSDLCVVAFSSYPSQGEVQAVCSLFSMEYIASLQLAQYEHLIVFSKWQRGKEVKKDERKRISLPRKR